MSSILKRSRLLPNPRMNSYERLGVFVIRLLSLLVLIYFLGVAIFLAVLAHGAGVIFLGPAVLALLVYLSAPFLARLVARGLD
jgi:hypothetical protein